DYVVLTGTPLEKARVFARRGEYLKVEATLLKMIETEETVSRREKIGVASAPYLALAKLYRKTKRRADEMAALERYEEQLKDRGACEDVLLQRLEKLRSSGGRG